MDNKIIEMKYPGNNKEAPNYLIKVINKNNVILYRELQSDKEIEHYLDHVLLSHNEKNIWVLQMFLLLMRLRWQ
ncbi:hypothetical protein [Enterococcus sp. CWB-B31]|uniref:hypothetical protein n=1 Tax=Enterococcus sp. CWB-B31 TaxID=2885159 RepID=UPI001E512938|nr:hypothetical protein [Enterococcus sp. CWB-B31]MCB5953675.1 hypothetical protein [Enterococcus sp. CWB-B31]